MVFPLRKVRRFTKLTLDYIIVLVSNVISVQKVTLQDQFVMFQENRKNQISEILFQRSQRFQYIQI